MNELTISSIDDLAQICSDELVELLDWTPTEDEIIELGAFDHDYGPAEDWPAWTDDFRFTDRVPDAVLDDVFDAERMGTPYVPAEDWDRFEPSEEDWKDYGDWSERLEYESQCGCRFR